MRITGKPKLELRAEVRDYIDLYAQLGQRAENFLPRHIIDNLRHFTRLCHMEVEDPVLQLKEIDRLLLDLKEAIPVYTDVSLMLSRTKNQRLSNIVLKKLFSANAWFRSSIPKP
jgi:hypothetical protein